MKSSINLICVVCFCLVFLAGASYAEESWVKPSFKIKETSDNNIYLTKNETKSDWITTVSPGLIVEPPLNRHKLALDYHVDLNYYANYNDENSDNHYLNTGLVLNFNEWKVDAKNSFRYLKDRAGAEDVNRIKKTLDTASLHTSFDLNKIDLKIGYVYNLEDYNSTGGIGDYGGKTGLSYEDLDTDNNMAEIETALKLWPKTSLLFSTDYGEITHKTGIKSDSDYFDLLIGLRGEPTAKSIVEGNVGYRNQDYEGEDSDFSSAVFNVSGIENFTSRDSLRLDLYRTTYETNYQNNAYYVGTYCGTTYEHGFTDRISGNLRCSYQRNKYPSSTIESGKTNRRKDDLLITGCGLKYKMPKDLIAEVNYEYKAKDSNFTAFDYDDSLVSVSLSTEF